MDHGGMHGGHHGMHDEPMCNMNMLFTWDTNNVCIIFESWRIYSTSSLIWSLLGVVVLTAGYEFVREISRRYEAKLERPLPERRERTFTGVNGSGRTTKIIKALLYATQVFYSFFIMLVFMTYNGWVMIAVAVGAFVGYMLFSRSPATKTVACH